MPDKLVDSFLIAKIIYSAAAASLDEAQYHFDVFWGALRHILVCHVRVFHLERDDLQPSLEIGPAEKVSTES
jgi:hypothetical protein